MQFRLSHGYCSADRSLQMARMDCWWGQDVGDTFSIEPSRGNVPLLASCFLSVFISPHPLPWCDETTADIFLSPLTLQERHMYVVDKYLGL